MHPQDFSRRQALEKLCMLGTGLAAAAPLSIAQTPVSASNSASAPDPIPAATGATYNIRDFGATGDGKTRDTAAIQKAIDAAASSGGGTIFVPNGIFLAGTIQLKDNITLHLAEGATILGSPDGADYRNFPGTGKSRDPLALVYANQARNVAITGRGRINGQGGKFTVKDGAPGRPFGIKLVECQDVLLEGVRVEDSAAWVIHLLCCERVVVRGVRVWSHVNYNNDGLDIDGCRDVSVIQCNFDCQDDAICLKSTPDRICENIMVSDCVASSHCNLIKMGTSSVGGFRNVTITNCVLVAPRYSKMLNGRQRGIGGINLELVDGGVMDRITISNIVMDGITLPLFIRLGDRGRRDKRPVGTLRNVIISNIVATNMDLVGSSITGLPGHMIENVQLSNLNFSYQGGGTSADAARPVPERPDAYPEGFMYGTLPAWGLYFRHVRGLKMSNIKLQLAAPDARHAVIFDDVEDLALDALDCACTKGAAPLIKMAATRNATIRGCRPQVPGGVFLKLEGADNAAVALLGNDLRGAGKPIDPASSGAIAQSGNL